MLPDAHRDATDLLHRLESFREGDMPWRNGRTWAYVYDGGPDVEALGKAAFNAFMSENALDPTVFPSLLHLENEVVKMCLGHVRAPEGAVGSFTTGGTESCMLAVKAARDFKGVSAPEIVLPATAHAAFHKAASYFGIRKVVVPVDPVSFRADPAAVEAAITPNTIQIVGSAVSYAHGVCDPIEELGRIALQHDVLFHVDGCIGAFLLPLFRDLGADVPAFDFTVPGVTSISMDLHKYGFCPKPSSVVLYRTKALRRAQFFSCADWTGYTVVNPTILSTRSGGPVAASWATLNYVGREGYLAYAKTMLEGTRRILDGIRAIEGLRVLGEPDTNLVAFAADREDLSIFRVADAMKARDWYVQPQLGFRGSVANIHLSVQPQCVPHTDAMLADLADSVAEVVGSPPGGAALKSALAGVDPRSLDDEAFDAILGMAGVSGVSLPDTMAEINELLNALPPAFTEEMLREFMNRLYLP